MARKKKIFLKPEYSSALLRWRYAAIKGLPDAAELSREHTEYCAKIYGPMPGHTYRTLGPINFNHDGRAFRSSRYLER